MKWLRKSLDCVIPIAFAAALIGLAPLRTGFELSTCEGYELMKGFLFSLGYWHSDALWNDQPPLHTFMLGILFRLFGPSAYAARLLQVVFSALLVWSVQKGNSKPNWTPGRCHRSYFADFFTGVHSIELICNDRTACHGLSGSQPVGVEIIRSNLKKRMVAFLRFLDGLRSSDETYVRSFFASVVH